MNRGECVTSMLTEDDVRRIVREEIGQASRQSVGEIRLGPGPNTQPTPEELNRLRDDLIAHIKLHVTPPSPVRHTTDPTDPRLGRGSDETPRPQNEVYLVLSETERAKGYLRPVRGSYRHETCGTTTTMGAAIAETYARDPWHYGSTYCVECQKHRPLTEFRWIGQRGEFQEMMSPSEWPPEILDAVVARRKDLES